MKKILYILLIPISIGIVKTLFDFGFNLYYKNNPQVFLEKISKKNHELGVQILSENLRLDSTCFSMKDSSLILNYTTPELDSSSIEISQIVFDLNYTLISQEREEINTLKDYGLKLKYIIFDKNRKIAKIAYVE